MDKIIGKKTIPTNLWHERKNLEKETDTHPCDDPSPTACMCKGACSCHWALIKIRIPDKP